MKQLRPQFVKLTADQRLYSFEKPIIALTGGIATGKSTVTKLLEQKGLKVIDADRLVKKVYQKETSKEFIRTQFPEAWKNHDIDFVKLREIFFKNSSAKTQIEQFIYQSLPEAFKLAADKIKDQAFYIYDVPLLFEKHLESKVDLSIVVYASREVQLARLIDRDKVKEDSGNRILDSQMDIEEKKMKADFVLSNMNSLTELAAEVDSLLLQILD